MQRTATRHKGKATTAPRKRSAVNDDNNWDDDAEDRAEAGAEWLEMASREKETSRIRRQMEARRELERRMEEKHLRSLVEDWAFK